MPSEYAVSDNLCPSCGSLIVYEVCEAMYCDDAHPAYEASEMLRSGLKPVEVCNRCYGLGLVYWCRNCGFDYSIYLIDQAFNVEDGWINAEGS